MHYLFYVNAIKTKLYYYDGGQFMVKVLKSLFSQYRK